MTSPAIAGVRRCGWRQEGGAYIEVPLSDYGMPLSHFLLDPAVPVGPEYGIPERGMILRDNILFDRIGGDYPNVLDFLIETAHMGVSRRIQGNFDFAKLDHETRYAIVHPRGYCLHEPLLRLENEADWLRGQGHNWLCPKSLHTAEHGVEGGKPCSGAWWEDVDGAYDEYARITTIDGHICYKRPENVEPNYLQAIIAVFPLVQISVIRARDGSHEKTLEKVSKVQGNVRVEVADA